LVAERNGGLRFDLAAFDLDGTLLRRDLEITDRTLAAMEGLRERGMRLVVATGRRYESAIEHAERLGFGGDDPVVCYGGSMVRRMDGETLLHRTLPKELGLEVLEWAAGRGLHARVFVDGRVITTPNSPASLRFSRRFEEPGVVVVDSPAEWLASAQEKPTKASAPAVATVNLNTANTTQLATLPGIGPKAAQRIVEYRQKNGGFKKIEELMNVRGIGEKSFLKLKPLISVAARTDKPAGER